LGGGQIRLVKGEFFERRGGKGENRRGNLNETGETPRRWAGGGSTFKGENKPAQHQKKKSRRKTKERLRKIGGRNETQKRSNERSIERR